MCNLIGSIQQDPWLIGATNFLLNGQCSQYFVVDECQCMVLNFRRSVFRQGVNFRVFFSGNIFDVTFFELSNECSYDPQVLLHGFFLSFIVSICLWDYQSWNLHISLCSMTLKDFAKPIPTISTSYSASLFVRWESQVFRAYSTMNPSGLRKTRTCSTCF